MALVTRYLLYFISVLNPYTSTWNGYAAIRGHAASNAHILEVQEIRLLPHWRHSVRVNRPQIPRDTLV